MLIWVGNKLWIIALINFKTAAPTHVHHMVCGNVRSCKTRHPLCFTVPAQLWNSKTWTKIQKLGLKSKYLDCNSNTWTETQTLELKSKYLDWNSNTWTESQTLGLKVKHLDWHPNTWTETQTQWTKTRTLWVKCKHLDWNSNTWTRNQTCESSR